MGKVAYRFIPCDEIGMPGEGSQFMLVSDEHVGVGSLIEEDLFGNSRWKVVEVRHEDQLFRAAHDEQGNEIPLGGAIVCKPVTGNNWLA